MDVVRHLWKSFLSQGVFAQGLFRNRYVYFSKLIKLIVVGAVTGIVASWVVSCNTEEKSNSSLFKNTVKNSLISNVASRSDSLYASQFNNVLLAELYSQFEKPALSAKFYQKSLTDSNDPELARRATILAASSGQLKEALSAVRHWVHLMPESLEARQYFSLLLLRNDDFNESVDQLYLITQIVENGKEDKTDAVYSRGLKFIGSMLNIESHHAKSLTVFQRYIKKYGTQKDDVQQYLIISSLAMNAKKYDVVLTALNNVQSHEVVQSPKIVLMKVTALQKLNKINQAAKILRAFIDSTDNKNKSKISDSIRLQLVRLLILDHQKKVASPYLRDLVKKYPKNNDLLKSLIALEIDQAQLNSAKRNLEKLSKDKKYKSDVAYFRGEIYEAEGDIQLALKNYQEVIDGNLKDRAEMKIIKLGGGPKVRKVNYKVE